MSNVLNEKKYYQAIINVMKLQLLFVALEQRFRSRACSYGIIFQLRK